MLVPPDSMLLLPRPLSMGRIITHTRRMPTQKRYTQRRLSPRTVFTGASPLENSSEYDFNGKGSSSASAAEGGGTPPFPASSGETVTSPINTAGVRTAASATVASACLAKDTTVSAVVMVVTALLSWTSEDSWACFGIRRSDGGGACRRSAWVNIHEGEEAAEVVCMRGEIKRD